MMPQATYSLAAIDIEHHISDGNEIHFLGLHFDLSGLSHLGITKHVVFLWVAAVFMILFFAWVARDRGLVPRRLRNMVEIFLEFLQHELIDPYMGHDGKKFLPYVATVFFFILFCNLLGLIPDSATPTGNIRVTAALAIITLVVIQGVAMSHGPLGYFHAIVPSVPWAIWPILFVVEVAGFLAKTMALSVRLFANMTAGHVVLLAILGFIFVFPNNIVAAVLAVGGAVAIYCLEVFVAFLQAYVFTFLTVVFIGGVLHPQH
jgi:F-type H+-transporting ATPase subunit a